MSDVLPHPQYKNPNLNLNENKALKVMKENGLKNVAGLFDILIQIDLDIKRTKAIENDTKKPYNKFVKE